MTAREFFPEGTLTLEQWDLVRALSATLSPGQALWVSGYFAGLDAGLNRAGGAAEVLPVASAGARTLTILYGTETGNAREVANNLANSAKAQGLAPEVFDMGNYKERRLKDEQDLLIVVSTYGEGDPPQPAVGFFDYVEGRKAHKMEGARFAVLALGDSTYELYCEAGKRLDKRFEELGAKRLFDRVDCDIDYEEHAAHWSEQVVAKLAAEAKEAGATARPSAAAVPAAAKAASAHDKRNPFLATVIDNIPIVGRHSTKETRHVELDLSGSGLKYEPGDALGLAATNEPQVVAALLDATGLSGDTQISVKGNTRPLAEAFERDYEITTSTPRFLEHWAKLTGAKELEELRGQDRAAERSAFLYGHHVVDIVRKFPLDGVNAETFVGGLRPLQPRLYSLASSQAIVDEEAHLTLSPVRYELHGIARSGVASAHLADRAEPGTQIPVYVQANPHFKLPTTDVPIIMIGPGTGVAPFRAFLQEREAQGVDGRSWLFFGERNFRNDFLYQTEWQDWLKQGVLTRLDVAFSRDRADKVYVQDRLREQAEDVYAWLEEGAHIYVCGDANHMAPDVHQALIEIIAEQGRIERESAEEYVLNLQRDQRYQRDVY
jgi:sulfite reductase (NADPH) flavoprotein alpha-component